MKPIGADRWEQPDQWQYSFRAVPMAAIVHVAPADPYLAQAGTISSGNMQRVVPASAIVPVAAIAPKVPTGPRRMPR